MPVAASTLTAFGRHKFLTDRTKVRENFTGLEIFDDGTERDFDHPVFAVGAVLIFALAVNPVAAFEMRHVIKINQALLARHRPKDDISAVAAVSA